MAETPRDGWPHLVRPAKEKAEAGSPRYVLVGYLNGRFSFARENLNAAQLGGVIAHTMEDYDSFAVWEQGRPDRVLMRYEKEGL